jgi:hypothetical protein
MEILFLGLQGSPSRVFGGLLSLLDHETTPIFQFRGLVDVMYALSVKCSPTNRGFKSVPVRPSWRAIRQSDAHDGLLLTNQIFNRYLSTKITLLSRIILDMSTRRLNSEDGDDGCVPFMFLMCKSGIVFLILRVY